MLQLCHKAKRSGICRSFILYNINTLHNLYKLCSVYFTVRRGCAAEGRGADPGVHPADQRPAAHRQLHHRPGSHGDGVAVPGQSGEDPGPGAKAGPGGVRLYPHRLPAAALHPDDQRPVLRRWGGRSRSRRITWLTGA